MEHDVPRIIPLSLRESSFNIVIGLKAVLKSVLQRKGKSFKVTIVLWLFFEEAIYNGDKKRLVNGNENQEHFWVFFFWGGIFVCLNFAFAIYLILHIILFDLYIEKKNECFCSLRELAHNVGRLVIQKRKARFLTGRPRTQVELLL